MTTTLNTEITRSGVAKLTDPETDELRFEVVYCNASWRVYATSCAAEKDFANPASDMSWNTLEAAEFFALALEADARS